jgi:hypothetical protein
MYASVLRGRIHLRTRVVLGAILLAAWATAARAQGVEGEAFLGEPFGVGRVTFDLPEAALPEPLGIEGLGLSEASGRVLYPAWRNPALAGVIKDLLGEDSPLTSGGPVRQQIGGLLRGILSRPPRTTIYFLFRGNEPLRLTLQARQNLPLTVQPVDDAVRRERLMGDWWRDYAGPRRLLQKQPDYPPLVETYLTSTLARRLNLRLPLYKQTPPPYAQFEQELDLTVGTESVRTGLEQDRLLDLTNFALPADQPLPSPPEQTPLAVAEPAADVQIEPIALHVPEECFYIRFGSFENFLWFQDTMATWHGDFQNLVEKRGINLMQTERIQRQLILEQSQLSRILGGTVISDVAMLGTDLLLADGPAMGFLFEARNNLLLSSDFNRQRADRVSRGGVTEQKLTIEGQEVSFIASPDGSVRSFYVARGDYHLVTASKALVARFLQTVKGRTSLGVSKEFRSARTIMPTSRGDTIFVYFSDAFFRNFTSPRYRVEMLRRMEAATDIEVVMLARLDAAAEGKPAGSIEELIAGGMLPPGFGPRPDGSRAVIAGRDVTDSLRGRRGTFLPVPDVPVDKVTQAEAASYGNFVQSYLDKGGRLEPIMVGVQRKRLEGNREQVMLDIRMTPVPRQQIEMLQRVAGPADRTSLAPLPGDMATFEAVLPSQRLFGGVRDVVPPITVGEGNLLSWVGFRNFIVGYLGNVGEPGVLGLLDATFTNPPDANGYSRNFVGYWRLQYGKFTLYTFQPEVLPTVAPQLHFQESERPAQLRVRVRDVANAQITPMLNNLGYDRTRQTELGNLRLLHSLDQQLHVPPKDSKATAESLLNAALTCPLGGQFILRETPGGSPRWTTTRLAQPEAQATGRLIAQAPVGYVAPPLSWFRGLDLDASLVDNVLSAHAEVIMQLPEGK